jgi:hypothetical protein
MAIESFDARQKFAVVAARDQYLVGVSDRRLEDGERPAGEFVLLERREFIFTERSISLERGKTQS